MDMIKDWKVHSVNRWYPEKHEAQFYYFIFSFVPFSEQSGVSLFVEYFCLFVFNEPVNM